MDFFRGDLPSFIRTHDADSISAPFSIFESLRAVHTGREGCGYTRSSLETIIVFISFDRAGFWLCLFEDPTCSHGLASCVNGFFVVWYTEYPIVDEYISSATKTECECSWPSCSISVIWYSVTSYTTFYYIEGITSVFKCLDHIMLIVTNIGIEPTIHCFKGLSSYCIVIVPLCILRIVR